ncbi:hypothetical protein BGW36DRAFT_377039 [Talaromyces proteolyticus]|uniref:Carboxymethylenebutenolidase n=1 Tax=Talaromyces proteolyticus TaxID=1131652 RepID=A0AAD4Q1V9_9EURO|nr:uncharacterized protein BGW36DRAFT_377039 [Talaromyces proteolyticus]KAH8698968.1 hypothetical protein BGW36DRAFT_377039 [Talaromyces proteolyticus]
MAQAQQETTASSSLPVPNLIDLKPGLRLLHPLSRRGNGPGLIVLPSDEGSSGLNLVDGVPSPLMKWAEEGYTVVEINGSTEPQGRLSTALATLASCESCVPKGKVGLVAYGSEVWSQIAPYVTDHPEIVGAVVYANTDTPITKSTIPMLQHLAGIATTKPTSSSDAIKLYHYSGVDSYLFATPFQEKFRYSTEAVSHTRNLTFLKPLMNGPYFDLEAIWEEHTYFEFDTRSVKDTMGTMVQEPYVNHIPTLTGGIGRVRLSDFYQNHFVFQNPADTELELISRTIGIDRVVDEFIYKFTHDMQIDWLLPGIPPTGRKAEIPFTGVVNIRGDRLYHEHISWDQTTALFQLGLMPEYLPYPYPLADGSRPAAGKRAEYRVPGTGRATAEKMRDRNCLASNEMFRYSVRVVDE